MFVKISESLTHRFAVPPLPPFDRLRAVSEVERLAGEGCGQLISDREISSLRAHVGLVRDWAAPDALKESGAWPLKGCRHAFLDGSRTRLLDPEEVNIGL